MIESFRVGRHAELREQALRQRVLQIQIPRFPCLAHQAGIGARRHILNGRIERLYAMRTCRKHLRALHAQLPLMPHHQPDKEESCASLQHSAAIGLVEPDALHLAGFVKNRGIGKGYTLIARGRGFFYARQKHRTLTGVQMSNLRAVVVIDIIPWQAADKLLRILQSGLVQRFQTHFSYAFELFDAHGFPSPLLPSKNRPPR